VPPELAGLRGIDMDTYGLESGAYRGRKQKRLTRMDVYSL